MSKLAEVLARLDEIKVDVDTCVGIVGNSGGWGYAEGVEVLSSLIPALEEARELLRAVELGSIDRETGEHCPICDGERPLLNDAPGPWWSYTGHEHDCRLALALGSPRREKVPPPEEVNRVLP